MPFQYTFRSDDISTWDVDTRDLIENRDRELELYSTTIDNSFLNLNASNLTSGTVPSARMTGAYTGITGLGTLTSLTIDGPLSPSVFFGDWNQNNNWSGIRGTFGYLLTGSSGGGDTGIFLRSESATHPVYIGSNNTNTLRVDNTSATVTGTMNATTFSGSGASLTSLPAGQLTGTISSARLNGTYTGIQAVGTLDTLTIGGAGANRYITINAPTGYYAIQYFQIGGAYKWHYEVNPAGDRWSLVQSGVAERIGVTSAGATFSGTVTATTFSGSGASLTSLNASNLSSGGVPGGRLAGSYTGITGVGTLAQELNVTGAACGFNFADRSGTGEKFVWYSTSADAYLYSSRLGDNIMGFARTTGIAYLYRGVTGNIQYGSYGSITMYAAAGGWAGISFPDTTSAMMLQNTYFGHYRNNTTWNFYVNNGTFVPSDERYKRDIQPLEHGLNFIREIVPVSYDPLTESLDDDPETTVGKTHYGFTTQNILQALSNAGETRDVAVVDIGGPSTEETNSDRQYLNHSALIAPMVKAIQELDARLQQLETV